MFDDGLCCWKLQLNLSDDFSKTVKRAPFKKTNSNQQQRKEDATAATATHSPHQLQQPKQKNSKTPPTTSTPRKTQPQHKNLCTPSKYTRIISTKLNI